MQSLIKNIAMFVTATLICNAAIAEDWRHYNENPDYQPSVLDNGTIANMEALDKQLPVYRDNLPKTFKQVIDDVWMMNGLFYGPVVIETDEGLIVSASGEHAHDGTQFREMIREQISDKPIIAVLYDHVHYAKGTRALLDGDEAIIVAHPDHEAIYVETGGIANPATPELRPRTDGGAYIQIGVHMPKDGPDAAPGLTVELGDHEVAWMPPTITMAHGETITIGGVDVQAFHATTDTEETLTFWIPEKKLIIDNVIWPMMNLYTLRGDRFRDPNKWIAALRDIRDLQPEICLDVGAGATAMTVPGECIAAVTALMDAMTFINDQAIRLTNMGVPKDQLRHFITMPESLNAHPFVNETYGQFDHFPEAVPTNTIGWYSGFSEDMHNLPDPVTANYWIDAIGGQEKVLEHYRNAMSSGEYLWAKELAVQLYNAEPANETYRQVLADVFRKLGQYSPGSISRAFYISAALSLEGNGAISLAYPQPAAWIVEDIPRAVSHVRVRVNPDKAEGVEGLLVFDVGDVATGLHVRNSIAEFVADVDAHYRPEDARIKVSPDEFASYFRGEMSAKELIEVANVSGTAAELLSVFDSFRVVPMYPAHYRGVFD